MIDRRQISRIIIVCTAIASLTQATTGVESPRRSNVVFVLADDPGETRNLAAKHPDRVKQMVAAARTLFDRGRSTEGPALKNDRKVQLFKSVPSGVWGR